MGTRGNSPVHPHSSVALAQNYLQSGRKHEAFCICQNLLADGTKPGVAWGRLGTICQVLGDVDGAAKAFKRHVDANPRDLAAKAQRAEILSEIGQTEQAILIANQLLAEIEAQGGQTSGLLRGLGLFHAQNGNFAQAEKYYRDALRAAPNETVNWENISAVKRFLPDDADIKTMQDLQKSLPHTAPIQSHIHLAYALGKAFADVGEMEAAFGEIAKGAKLNARQMPFDAKAYRDAVLAIQEAFVTAPNPNKTQSKNTAPRPIFILGVPRSGTSLVEQILTSHPQVCGGGEMKLLQLAMLPLGDIPGPQTDDFLATDEPNSSTPTSRYQIAKTYHSLLSQRFGETGFVTDKNLSNAIYVGVIARAFPDAKFIYCQRDPLDLAWSCFKKNFGTRLGWSNNLVDIAHFIHIYEQMMAFWHTQIPERILPVPYEKLVASPKTWADEMLQFCQLSKDQACYQPHQNKRPVTTASLAQVRQPIYQKSVGSATPYRTHLAPFVGAYRGLGGVLRDAPSA